MWCSHWNPSWLKIHEHTGEGPEPEEIWTQSQTKQDNQLEETQNNCPHVSGLIHLKSLWHFLWAHPGVYPHVFFNKLIYLSHYFPSLCWNSFLRSRQEPAPCSHQPLWSNCWDLVLSPPRPGFSPCQRPEILLQTAAAMATLTSRCQLKGKAKSSFLLLWK